MKWVACSKYRDYKSIYSFLKFVLPFFCYLNIKILIKKENKENYIIGQVNKKYKQDLNSGLILDHKFHQLNKVTTTNQIIIFVEFDK